MSDDIDIIDWLRSRHVSKFAGSKALGESSIYTLAADEIQTLRAIVLKLTRTPIVDHDGCIWSKPTVLYLTPAEADVVRRCEQ